MSILNKLKCATEFANTGIGSCWQDIGKIVGAIITPTDFKLSESSDLLNIESLILKLQLCTLKNDIYQRIYPLWNFIDIEDGSEDAVVNTSGYGYDKTTREGQYKWSFRYNDGAMCLNAQLHRLAKNRKFKVFFIDDKNQLIGTKIGEFMHPLTLGNFDPKKLTIATGDAPAMYHVEFTLPRPQELNENPALVDLGTNPSDVIKGLINIELKPFGAITTSAINVRVLAGCEKVDLFDMFDSELSLSANWKLTNKATGANVAITSVSNSPINKTIGIAFPPTANTEFVLRLVSPEALSLAGIGVPPANGYESIPLTFKTP